MACSTRHSSHGQTHTPRLLSSLHHPAACQVLGRVPPAQEDAANKKATLPRPSCRQFRGRHRRQALLLACTVSCRG